MGERQRTPMYTKAHKMGRPEFESQLKTNASSANLGEMIPPLPPGEIGPPGLGGWLCTQLRDCHLPKRCLLH